MLFIKHSPVRILGRVARRMIQNPSSRHVSVNTRYHHTSCYTCSGWTRRRGGPFSGQAPPSINPTVSPLTHKLLSYHQKFSTSGQENKEKFLIDSNLVLRKYLEGLVEEYDGLNRTLLDLSGDSEGIGKRMVELEPLVQRMVQFQRKQAQLGEIGQMVTGWLLNPLMLRLLSSNAKESKYVTLSCWYSLDSPHGVLSDEYPFATQLPWLQCFFRMFALFCMGQPSHQQHEG